MSERPGTTRPDPPVRADGLCAHCHGPRLQRLPKVLTQRSRAELIDNLTADPFCSAVCCRAHHQLDIHEHHAKAHNETREWAVNG